MFGREQNIQGRPTPVRYVRPPDELRVEFARAALSAGLDFLDYWYVGAEAPAQLDFGALAAGLDSAEYLPSGEIVGPAQFDSGVLAAGLDSADYFPGPAQEPAPDQLDSGALAAGLDSAEYVLVVVAAPDQSGGAAGLAAGLNSATYEPG